MIVALMFGLAALVVIPSVASLLFVLGFSAVANMIAKGEHHDESD